MKNKWVKFALWAALWTLVFVVWMRNVWMLAGLLVICDLCVSKWLHRHVIEPYRTKSRASRAGKEVAEMVEAVVFAVVVATLVHTLVFQMYVIPSPSMEKTLLVGDYLYVSKLSYGPKLANTPLSLPLVHNTMPFSKTGAKSYSEAIHRPYKRLWGPKRVRRDDVVVFNFPAGDTVMLENINATYYDYVRNYTRALGEAEGRRRLASEFTIVARPVDKRENYVKRCVGLPGDTIELRASQLYVNGVAQSKIAGQQQYWRVTTLEPFTYAALSELGIRPNDVPEHRGTGVYEMFLTADMVEKIRAMANVATVELVGFGGETFPHDGRAWTENDFGPLWIPARGATVALTVENLPLYERIIDAYEGNDLRVEGETIYINGAPATEYTFRMDYFWMMGDNRQDSADSRFWGFVPEDHIVGKASFVWLSLDKERGLLDGKIRWSRMFRKIR